MDSSDAETLELLLEKEGGIDIWLPPLALIGCIVVLGPVLALVLQNIPSELVMGNQLWVGVILTGTSVAVLLSAFLFAQMVVGWSHRLLRVGSGRLAVCDRKGRKEYASAALDELVAKRQQFVIRAQQGIFVSPIVALEFPDDRHLTLTVNEADFEWEDNSEAVEEVEEEATYTVATPEWRKLLEALDLA